ncbi:VPS35B VPS35 homolog B [Klebsormidium nitens]|uniref:Vacuolar protein sorting-associated protein 35 n=1 Tax=Klebsormidium nitens TaxID=105231 RepID=A0A1Y1I153_KLENI|nr:VPS35B VPS35 homolog B [Klebsormidium nitens]|eukprot:GAQ84640.1 VPS35B VPS35 homolog B [Klebsormidium nitens]
MNEHSITATEEQEKWLADAQNVVKQQSFYMRKALDSSNLREALKYSAQMLVELRTSKLSPQKYYELYMQTFDELRHLEAFFQEESKRGRSNADLYELVQHAGNILPRLYLLITVGSVYIRSKEAPAKDILKDLVEMSRGVQHPIRGLFLRSYLSQISKDKLPDTGSDYEGEGGTIHDAVEFVLQNFTEMNKLWVRMQHQGSAKDKADREKREKERSELRDLVGKNLLVLSQLEGVDLELYKSTVLPRVLEQVVNCKDEIAQGYLMDCIIQVFPDEYHLQTLETLLAACPQLQPKVDIKSTMAGLMERLANYAAANSQVLSVFAEVEAFEKLSTAVATVVEAQVDMPLVSAVSLHVALLNFVLRCHADRLDYVDSVLGSCVKMLAGQGKIREAKSVKAIVALLSEPLAQYGDVVTVLQLGHYGQLMATLEFETNKVMAVLVIQSILKNGTRIGDCARVEALFQLLQELIRDGEDAPPVDQLDQEDFAEEQNLVARLLHVLVNDDPEEQFKILSAARKQFGLGGPRRLVFTLPPLVVESLKLVRRLQARGEVEEGGVTPKKVFQFLHQTVEALANVPAPELAFRLYLLCAEAASDCDLEPIAYEFFTQAFILYEEDIADSKAQVTALQLMTGTLQRTVVFGTENRDTLTHKATGYSAKLLKKPDQCRAVYNCSHLFWQDQEKGTRDGERVLLCLKRALRIANAAQQQANATRGSGGPVTLFVEILNKYLYHFDKGNQQVTTTVLQGLLELISTEVNSESAVQDPATEAFYASTLKHISFQKQKGGEAGDRYEAIKVQ